MVIRMNAGLFVPGCCLALTVLGALPVAACGPHFPNRLLDDGDAGVLQMPVGVFTTELARVTGPRTDAWNPLSGVNAGSVSGALASATLAWEERRAAEDRGDRALLAWDAVFGAWAGTGPAPAVPTGIAPEYGRALTGAMLWLDGRREAAVARWEQVFELPPDERRFRSVWTAFMLGRACRELGRTGEAIGWFRKTRELIDAGLVDGRGLDVAVVGWEARAELDLSHYERATELYFEHLAAGDPTAFNSLRFVALKLWAGEQDSFPALVRNDAVRRLLVVYAVAYLPDPAPLLDALERAGVRDEALADRLAWAAYAGGDYDAARRWLALAPDASPVASLVKARLLLRSGDVAAATAQLRRIVRAFPEAVGTERWGGAWLDSGMWDLAAEPFGERLRGELGVLALARRDYVEALDLLLRGGYWHDAAYVADRVLTTPELKAYVDREFPTADSSVVDRFIADDAYQNDMGPVAANIRYLLGRRLVRDGRLDEAASYMPGAVTADLKALAAATGAAARARGGERAAALWRAACITRYRGMELMGFELDPDFATFGGAYEWPILPDRVAARTNRLVRASGDELKRAAGSAPAVDQRFHYRFIAADLAWQAASLMPDNSDETARVLCLAGVWLKDRYPASATRFYRALTTRCGTTVLGRQAAARKWFPELEVDAGRLLEEGRTAAGF